MNDFRLAARELRAAPVVTTMAVLSLALGIGANTAIFSVVNSLLLRPLPVVEPEQLAVVSDSRAVGHGRAASFTYGIWDELRKRVQGTDGSCAWWTERVNLSPRGGEREMVDAVWASGDYFTMLGVPPLLGRTITTQDDVPGAPAVAVLSFDMWQRRFDGAANVIGKTLVVERVPFTIVGVAPPGFFGAEVGRTFDVALPMNAEPLIRGERSRISRRSGFFALTILLRLKHGQSVEATTKMLRGIQPQVQEAAIPSTLPAPLRKEFLTDPFTAVSVPTGTSGMRTQYERPLIVILVVVGLVLLIACANIANLQLARAIARRHEMSVRVALGASRWRLARHSLTESLLLSSAGAVLGVIFASWSSRLLVAQLSTELNRVHLDLSFDWRLLAFSAAIAIGTAVLFGTVPALRASNASPIEALNEQGRGSSGRAPARLSDGMVVVQVALALVIVVGAGLFVRTFAELATMPLGIETNRVLLVRVSLARSQATEANRVELIHRIVREVAAVPGVAKAAASMNTPVAGFGMIDLVHVPGGPGTFRPFIEGKLGPQSTYSNYVTAGWFAAYGTRLRAGRDFDDRDVKNAPPVIIVNDAFVRKFMAGKNPVGETVGFERGLDKPVVKTVVGVVSDAVYDSVKNEDVPTQYAPLAQLEFPGGPVDPVINVRAASGDPMLLARSVGAAITAVDGDVTFGFRALTDQVSSSLTQERIVAMLSAFFGALALLLAGLGLYGMISYAVARRRAEIGVRLALGSTGAKIVRLVVARAAGIVAMGIVIGGVASVWASKFVATLVFRIDPRDPVTLGTAAATLAIVGAAAAWLPAYRASRLDPASVLREQ
jgi:predicted permease